MRIGIDISQIIYETGVAWYTNRLVTNLSKIDSQNEYVLFGGSLRKLNKLKDKTLKLGNNFVRKFYPIPPTVADFIWNNLHIFNIEFFTGKLDIFHSSDWTQPPTMAFKVTTVHDIDPIKFSDFADPKIVKVHNRRLRWIKEEVDRIIVPSHTTKNDLIDLGFKEQKIRVIAEAPTIEKPATKESIEKVREIYQIHLPFILSIGIGYRKNTDRIIEAFKLFNKRKDYQLVLVGRTSNIYNRDKNIFFTGHISQKEIVALYSGAALLTYPSLYEGFGLPILDAFVCGCPVVTSNISSMPEVAGAAAVLVNPYNVSSIAEGIQKAIKSKYELIQKGYTRVKKFSWIKAAKETLKVYEECL